MGNSALAKQFPINTASTTSSTFQVDSANAGPKLKNNAGIMEVRDSADSVYAQLKQLQSGCRVYLSGTQTFTGDAETVIAFDTESWDLNAEFNVSTYRFTAKQAGYYNASLMTTLPNTVQLGGFYDLRIYKNTVLTVSHRLVHYFLAAIGNVTQSGLTSNIFYLNGSTDYIEFRLYHCETLVLSASDTINFATIQIIN